MVALIKTENKPISWLCNVNIPMTLSPEGEMAMKNKDLYLMCQEKFIESSGEMSVHDHDHLSNPI